MKQYPSILGPSKAPLGSPCIAFYKYDGSNLRFEWTKKRSWFKFGTRHHLFDSSDPTFGLAISLFSKTYAEPLEKLFVLDRKHFLRQPNDPVIVFCEFSGDKSQFGVHEPGNNDNKQLILFDVSLHKKGIIPPKDFVSIFEPVIPIAKVIYEGNLNKEFISAIKNGSYPSVKEGVVCKGIMKDGKLWMVKVKTNWWFEELKKKSLINKGLESLLKEETANSL